MHNKISDIFSAFLANFIRETSQNIPYFNSFPYYALSLMKVVYKIFNSGLISIIKIPFLFPATKG